MDSLASASMVLLASLLIASGCCKKNQETPPQKPAAGGYNQAPTQPQPQPVAPGVMPRCNYRCHAHCTAPLGTNPQSIPNVNPAAHVNWCSCKCHITASTPAPTHKPGRKTAKKRESMPQFHDPDQQDTAKPMKKSEIAELKDDQQLTTSSIGTGTLVPNKPLVTEPGSVSQEQTKTLDEHALNALDENACEMLAPFKGGSDMFDDK